MQGKEKKHSRDRDAERNENRWNEERTDPLQQKDGGEDLLTQDPVHEEAKNSPLTDERKKDQSDPSEWERKQEKAILKQLDFHSPPILERDGSKGNQERVDSSAGTIRSEDEEKRKPAGELIWQKPTIAEREEEADSSYGEEGNVPAYRLNPSDSTETPEREESETEKPVKRRMATVWKVLLFVFFGLPLLAVVALVGGLLIGYSVVGNDPAGDVLTRDLWQHLYNLIYG
jgi:hypothetical protein